MLFYPASMNPLRQQVNSQAMPVILMDAWFIAPYIHLRSLSSGAAVRHLYTAGFRALCMVGIAGRFCQVYFKIALHHTNHRKQVCRPETLNKAQSNLLFSFEIILRHNIVKQLYSSKIFLLNHIESTSCPRWRENSVVCHWYLGEDSHF